MLGKILNNLFKEPTLLYKFIKSLFQDGFFLSLEKVKIKITNGYFEPTLLKRKRNISIYNQELKAVVYEPFVSVIVPNYNHAKFLNKRIDSILEQTYKNYEILLLDDCSTDNSREVLQNYASKYPDKIKTIFNEINGKNVFKQWRKGIESSCGDLIWICERYKKSL